MNANKKHIESLVERFFDGSTAHAEEQELYTYFASHEGADDPRRDLFGYFDSGIEAELVKEKSGIQAAQRIKSRPHKAAIIASKEYRHEGWFSSKGRIIFAASIAICLMLGILGIQYGNYANREISYIVCDGKIITDPKIVQPAIEEMKREIEQQRREVNEILSNAALAKQEVGDIKSQIMQIQYEIQN